VSSRPASPYASLGQHLLAMALFGVMAIVWSFPLVLHTGSVVPGAGIGDNASFLWNVWWMREAPTIGGGGFFHTTYLLAPGGIDLTLHTHTAFQAWIGATLLRHLSVIEAQNLVILGSLALNGFCAYLLAFDRLRRWWPSVAAGWIFGAAPYLGAHLLGHFNLISAWGLPLFTLLWLRTLESKRLTPAVLSGLTLGVIAYTDYYYFVYACAIALCLGVTATHPAAIRVRSPRATRLRWLLGIVLVIDLLMVAGIALGGGTVWTLAGLTISMTRTDNPLTVAWIAPLAIAWFTWPLSISRSPGAAQRISVVLRPASFAFVVAGACTLPLLWRAASLWTSGNYVRPVHLWKSAPAGIDLLALTLPSPIHPLWGAATSALYQRFGLDAIEGIGWVGVVPVVLTAVALWRQPGDAERRYWVGLGMTFFVWSLGPWLHVAGVNTGLPLPQGVLSLLPIVGNARIPGRGLVVVMLALAMISACALSKMRRSVGISALAIFLVAFDFCQSPFPVTDVVPSALDLALQKMPQGIVLPIPFGVRDGLGQIGLSSDGEVLAQITHHHPIAGGFVARTPPAAHDQYLRVPTLRALLELSTPDGDAPVAHQASGTWSARELHELGVRYVILDRRAASASLLTFMDEHLAARPVITDRSRELYLLNAPP